eukprot:868056-Ditylum_brightwellii.AAC.1
MLPRFLGRQVMVFVAWIHYRPFHITRTDIASNYNTAEATIFAFADLELGEIIVVATVFLDDFVKRWNLCFHLTPGANTTIK